MEADRSGRVGAAAALLILGAWGAWACLARVRVFEVADRARLEVASSGFTLSLPVEGRVDRVSAQLGDQVRRGQILLALEATPQRLELAQEQARQRSAAAQASQVRAQLSALESAELDQRESARGRVEEQRARQAQAQAQARLRAEEAARLERLGPGDVSDVERLRAQTEASDRRRQAESEAAAASRLLHEARSAVRERAVARAELRRSLAALEGEAEVARAAAARLEAEIERSVLRAPADGTIAEWRPLHPGDVLRVGEVLGSLLPQGKLQAVAAFPASALGRVREGQAARVMLDGFAWAQFGALAARVSSVAKEVRDGQVRVTLSVEPSPQGRIPLQHGLPGSVEVELERASPLSLLLRAAGRLVHPAPGAVASAEPVAAVQASAP